MVSRTFPGRYESLAEIGEFVRDLANQAGLGNFATYTVEMAVDEACSNIIEHAYGGEDRGDIICTCSVDSRGLRIELEDHGKPFDPQLIADPDIKGSLEERSPRGLGLYFIHQWMDQVEFRFKEGNGNLLILFKKRPASQTKTTRKRK